jgi:hypothetical protein
MPDVLGVLVGTPEAAALPMRINKAYKGGAQHVLVRDFYEGDLAQNDRILLGKIRSDAILDPLTSVIWFDDLGTSVTMDIGSTAAENALVAAQDVATAAGSCSILKSVDIANYHKKLWQLLGLSADPGVPIEIWAKFEGANPATGTVAWQIIGQPW